MKLTNIFEQQELLPRSPMKQAETFGKRFVKLAVQKDSSNIELEAKRIASTFHKAIVAAIDEDIKFRNMKQADRPNRSSKSYGNH